MTDNLELLSRECGRYQQGLVKYLRREFALPEAEARDIADEALAKAVRNIGRFDESRCKLTTWLWTIAGNCARDRLKSAERRRATVSVDDLHLRPGAPAHPDPAEEYRARRLAEKVREAVANLLALQRQAVQLCKLDGLAHAEAAEKLGVPVRRLRYELHKGIKALGQSRELRMEYYGRDYSPKEARARKGRAEGDGGVQ